MPARNNKLTPQSTHIYVAYASLLLATAIWGAAGPVIKITLEYFPVFTFLFFRFLIVCVVVLIPLIIELKKSPIDKRDIPSLVLLGLTGQASIILIFLAYNASTVLDVAIIGAMAPLIIIVAGHYFYNERVGTAVKIGVFIATLGTLLVVLEPLIGAQIDSKHALIRVSGNLIAIFYNVSFAAYIIISKLVLGQKSSNLTKLFKKIKVQPMQRKYTPFVETALTFYVAFVTVTPFAIAENLGWFGGPTFSMEAVNYTSIAGILYMAIFSSIVAYVAFEWGLKKAAATDSAIFSYLGPIFTIPFAYILLKELPTQASAVGMLIIATGVIIAETKKS